MLYVMQSILEYIDYLFICMIHSPKIFHNIEV